MKIMLIGDVHHAPHAEFAESDRVGRTEAALVRCFGRATQERIDHVVLLGDVFEGKGAVRLDLVHHVAELVAQWTQDGRGNVWAVTGNHDIVKDTGSSGLMVLFDAGALVASSPVSMRLDDVQVAFLPWTSTAKDVEDAMSECDVALGHLDVDGSEHCGVKVPGRFKPSLFTKPTFLGHYHVKQQMGEQVVYVGCLLAQNFGDGHSWGPVILDTDSMSTKQLDVGSPGNEDFVTVRVGLDGEREVVRHPEFLGTTAFVRLQIETDGSVDLEEAAAKALEGVPVVENEHGERAVRVEAVWNVKERRRVKVKKDAGRGDWVEAYVKERAPSEQAAPSLAKAGNRLLEEAKA